MKIFFGDYSGYTAIHVENQIRKALYHFIFGMSQTKKSTISIKILEALITVFNHRLALDIHGPNLHNHESAASLARVNLLSSIGYTTISIEQPVDFIQGMAAGTALNSQPRAPSTSA